jgi:hypothetical protein
VPYLTSLMEVPAHTAIAPSESALRAMLDAPSDLPLTQWQITPLRLVSRHLEGCVWQLVGCIVPTLGCIDPTVSRYPGYPYMQSPDDLSLHLQVWLWRTSKPPPHDWRQGSVPLGWNRPWGDLRWHPTRGMWMAIELLPSDEETVVRQVWRWVHATELASEGPSVGDTCPWTRNELIQKIRDAVASVRRLRNPTNPRIWSAMGYAGDPKTLVRWCQHRMIDLNALKRER